MARFNKLEFGSAKPPAPGGEGPLPAAADQADWIARADDSRRAGLYEIALKYYSRALELDKTLIAGWLGQVRMLVMLGEAKEAELWARKSLELFPANGELQAGRAQALCRLGNFKHAYAACDAALGAAGQSAYRWIVRGEIMLAQGHETDGACFDKAQQLDADWLVPLEIALIYLHYRAPVKALPRARRAAEAAAESAYAWYVRGRCEAAMGLSGAARLSARHCLQLSPRHADARRLLQESGGDWFGKRWWRRLFG
jgi:tetratricopeptide (TPR) repeat protein